MITIFLIPGFKLTTEECFGWFELRGVKITEVPIRWNYRVMDDYCEQFREIYRENKATENYVIGFSYGAVVAFMTAAELLPDGIICCSLSPDFKEDLSWLTKTWPNIANMIGKRRLANISTRSARKIAKQLIVPARFLYGQVEAQKYSQLSIRSKEVVRLAKDAEVLEVPGAPHDTNFPAYQKQIQKSLDQFLS